MSGAMADAGTLPIVTAPALARREEEAARLVAEDERTDEQIATAVGVSKMTIERWKKRPAFSAEVRAQREAFRARIMAEGFADKARRIKALNLLATAVLVELSREADDRQPQGMYRLEKKISANGEIVEQEVFDKPKADTFRGYLDDIAKELGDRKTIIDATIKDREIEDAADRLAAKTGRDRAVLLAELRARTKDIEREQRAG